VQLARENCDGAHDSSDWRKHLAGNGRCIRFLPSAYEDSSIDIPCGSSQNSRDVSTALQEAQDIASVRELDIEDQRLELLGREATQTALQ
jgi:hypothetical protein